MSKAIGAGDLQPHSSAVTLAEPNADTFYSGGVATVIAGALVTAVVTLFFLSLFWNRFIGLRSGDGGFGGGVFFLKGILPYRDYYCPVPPLFLLRSAAALALFGKLPIVLRALGVFERIILSLLL